jgi:hypothetical protein
MQILSDEDVCGQTPLNRAWKLICKGLSNHPLKRTICSSSFTTRQRTFAIHITQFIPAIRKADQILNFIGRAADFVIKVRP